MNILEKLGYSRWDWEQTEPVETSLDVFIRDIDGLDIAWSYTQKSARLLTSAPEMLEALIRRIQTDYIYVQCGEIDFRDIQSDVNIIEKATGKSWEEIKELMK